MKLFMRHTAPLPTFLRSAAAGFNAAEFRYSIPLMCQKFGIIIIWAAGDDDAD